MTKIFDNNNMIKPIKLISLMLLALPIVSCGPSDSRYVLTYGNLYDEEMTDITYLDLVSMVDGKESFVLALYPGQLDQISCGCWREFNYRINLYVKDNLPIIYATNIYQVTMHEKNFGLTEPRGEEPSLAFFNKGKLVKQYHYSSAETFWKDEIALKSLIEKHTFDPHLIYINDALLENIKASQNKKMVSFVRHSCGDCSYVLPNYLIPYFRSHKLKQYVYLYDFEALGHYKKNMSDEEKALYQEKKDSLLLSATNNENYGYITGVVPTTFVYQNNEIIDGNVFFNDTLSYDEERECIYVSNSYFSQERKGHLHYLDNVSMPVLEGLEIDSNDTIEYEGQYYWRQEKAALYHGELFSEFLKYYLK